MPEKTGTRKSKNTMKKPILTGKKTILTGGILLIFIGAGLILPLRHLFSPNGIPDLAVKTIDGRELNLKSLQGAPLLVTFWATTCHSCLEEMPHLIALYHELNPAGLQMLAIAMPYDPPNRVVALAERENIPYPVALDLDGRAARAFGPVNLTPTSLLFGPNGRIIKRKSGLMNMPKLKQEIRKLLGDRQAGLSFHTRMCADALV